MAKKKIPLALITLFHPDVWLAPSGERRLSKAQLESLPRSVRDRSKLERMRHDQAQISNLNISYQNFHERDRPISSAGTAVHRFRGTWIPSDEVALCLKNLEVRLIYTAGENPQAGYRLEYRPNWDHTEWSIDSNYLSTDLTRTIPEKVHRTGKLNILALWENPFATNFYPLPNLALEAKDEVANLVMGPFNDRSLRKAELEFECKGSVWWLSYTA